jgi:ectoine hydroxylase-related dioxygenase (phytanoyl-CoA dioxygenase family)
MQKAGADSKIGLTKSELIPVFRGDFDREEGMAGAVSEAARAQLAEEGWCVIPDVLTPEAAKDALDHLWALHESNVRDGTYRIVPGLDPNEQNVRVYNLIQADPYFRDLVQNETALEAVRAVLGEKFIISNFTANIARPGSGSMALHSDQSLVAPEPWLQPWSVNIIWCLTDAYFENGATMFIPGSHHWRSHAEVPPDAAKQLRAFEAKAGSVVVMEGRVWHTSGANITQDQDRALLFGYYSAAFLRPQTNWALTIPQEVWPQLSPQMLTWLGLEALGNRAFSRGFILPKEPAETK